MKMPPMLQARGGPTAPPRVGHLVPLPGVVARGVPDRAVLERFLDELLVPLRAVDQLLDVLGEAPVGSEDDLASDALRNHGDYLCRFVDEFRFYGRLMADEIVPSSQATDLVGWLDRLWQQQQALVTQINMCLTTHYRSFLPTDVRFDQGLVAQAVDAVLHCASRRTDFDSIHVAVHFLPGSPGDKPQLVFEIETNGGGFLEIETGYVFVPMQVRDVASRPLFGLTIAHRLAELLGGSLEVQCDGRARCRYRLAVSAEPAASARWVDPLDPERELGTIVGRDEG